MSATTNSEDGADFALEPPWFQRYTAGLTGSLYLVATPIGNLEDITLRALRILRDEAAVIACEDTRQTQKLLDHFGIHKETVSYHDHNEASRTAQLIARLQAGDSVALVSDAGTPLISDPGFRLLRASLERNIPVVPIPGPSAALTAMVGSGLPVNEFRFIGFLPPKSGARCKVLQQLAREQTTLIFYESPHRLLESLEDVVAVLGNRPIAVARELTKLHEEFVRGSAKDVLEELRARPSIKGEITVLVGGAQDAAAEGDPVEEVARLQTGGLDRMSAIKQVARQFGLPKRDLYRLVENGPERE
jgi:16S rRNA (cytidine1402-2'-O)-methyltransferase